MAGEDGGVSRLLKIHQVAQLLNGFIVAVSFFLCILSELVIYFDESPVVAFQKEIWPPIFDDNKISVDFA